MKHKLYKVRWLLCFALLLFVNLAFGERGILPSVRVVMDDSLGWDWYATLLAKEETSGEYTIWTGEGEFDEYVAGVSGGLELWEKFRDYPDEDGYHFLGFVQESVFEDVHWWKRAPADFKLLVYFPETDTLAASEVQHRYLNHGVYEASLMEDGTLVVKPSPKQYFLVEYLMFAIRLAAALLVELFVAVCFGASGRGYWSILKINLLTQCTINTGLKVFGACFSMHSMVLAGFYLMVVGAAALESWYYGKKEVFPGRKSASGVYAFAANILMAALLSITLMLRA